ncbi:MAG: DUF6152 family protein [Gammaproteobacteria bacterium]|nr:DUF6152 family protein [Gammaproteobacteria bacterium]
MKWNTMARLLVACSAMLGAATVVLGHHSFAAQYDSEQLVNLQGTVTNVEWMNPHTFFYVDVVDAEGHSTNWAVEGGAPNVLYRRGWKPDSLKAGDKVNISGHKARDGSNLVRGLTFEFTDGRCLFFGVAGLDGAAVESCSD